MELDEFLARERAEGKPVSEDSAFTLDPAQVRARVATFCSEDRLYPLLRCLQGILRVTESDLFLHYEADSWVTSFRWNEIPLGKQFQGFVLEGAREGFDQVPHGASQHFFFGLSAALGVGHYRVSLSSPKGGFQVDEGKLELTEEKSSEYCRLTFSIDAGWWERLSGAKSRLSDADRELRKRLCYSSVPVHINGERLTPLTPIPPDRPWASRISEGSNLAWRYLLAPSGSRLRPPEVPLDRYRVGKKGKIMHLLKDDPDRPLPLSVQFSDAPLPAESEPDRSNPFASAAAGSALLCRSALFLSLQAGRQDWLFPVRDGLLGEPMKVDVAGGGVLVVSADDDLRYDLSGFRVVSDKRLEQKLALWTIEAKALKSQLRVSLANIGIRAETMPSQYYQASGYVIGGPYAGLLGGRIGPWLKRTFAKRAKS